MPNKKLVSYVFAASSLLICFSASAKLSVSYNNQTAVEYPANCYSATTGIFKSGLDVYGNTTSKSISYTYKKGGNCNLFYESAGISYCASTTFDFYNSNSIGLIITTNSSKAGGLEVTGGNSTTYRSGENCPSE